MNQERIAGEFREGMPFLGSHLWIDFLNTTPVIKGMALDLITPERIEVLETSPNYFELLGAGGQLGRVYTTKDAVTGFSEPVVISVGL